MGELCSGLNEDVDMGTLQELFITNWLAIKDISTDTVHSVKQCTQNGCPKFHIHEEDREREDFKKATYDGATGSDDKPAPIETSLEEGAGWAEPVSIATASQERTDSAAEEAEGETKTEAKEAASQKPGQSGKPQPNHGPSQTRTE